MRLLLLLVGLAEMKCVMVCSGPEGKKLDLQEKCKTRHSRNEFCVTKTGLIITFSQCIPTIFRRAFYRREPVLKAEVT